MFERIINLFNGSPKVAEAKDLGTDVHSHLLPELDDGVNDYQESLRLLQHFRQLGYTKVITTPHVSQDFYNNTEDDIRHQLSVLKSLLDQEDIALEVDAAAEYYLDEYLIARIKKGDTSFLTFGDNYLLFETSFMNEPLYLNDFVFEARSRGLQPVMAHPERYTYMHNQFNKVIDLADRGVLFQVNINSFTGYYSREARKMAERLVNEKLVHLLGSDCHHEKHLEILQRSRQEKYYFKALQLPLINYTL